MARFPEIYAATGMDAVASGGLGVSLLGGTNGSDLALLVVGMLIAGSVVGLTGFGFNLFSVPMLSLLLSPRTGIPLSLAVGLSVFTVSLLSPAIRTEIERSIVWRLLRASLLGIPIGVLIFRTAPEAALGALVGTVTVGYAVSVLVRQGRATRCTPPGPTRGAAVLAGVASGVLAGSTGLSGPPVALFAHHSGLEAARFRATLLAYFLKVTIISLLILTALQLVDVGVWATAALLSPAALLGMAIGRGLFARVPVAAFQRIVIGLLLVAGLLNLGKTAL